MTYIKFYFYSIAKTCNLNDIPVAIVREGKHSYVQAFYIKYNINILNLLKEKNIFYIILTKDKLPNDVNIVLENLTKEINNK